MVTLQAQSERDTARIGSALAGVLQPGDVVLLSGDLGAGKSTLARALIRGRAGEEIDVPSPTFALVEPYDFDVPLVHVDLYRLDGPEQIVELGLEDAMDAGIAVVEWPERAPGFFNGPRLDITIEQGPEETRMITLTPRGDGWAERVQGLGLQGIGL